MYKQKAICIKTYWLEEKFLEIAADAEQAGIRRKGLPAYTQKKNGFADEKLANTDRIAAFLKYCYEEYKRNRAKRLEEEAQIIAEEQRLLERKKKLGILETKR